MEVQDEIQTENIQINVSFINAQFLLVWHYHSIWRTQNINISLKRKARTKNEEDLEKNQFGTTYYADYFDKYMRKLLQNYPC